MIPFRPALTRRDLLSWTVTGLSGTALATLLLRDGLLAQDQANATAKPAARAKRVIHICLIGGLSHIDSFDYKPKLSEMHGQPLGASEKPDTFFGQIGRLRSNDWAFRQRGSSGLWVSDLFPHIFGSINLTAIISALDFEPDPVSGSFVLPSALATDN
jgi:hypothetical protein